MVNYVDHLYKRPFLYIKTINKVFSMYAAGHSQQIFSQNWILSMASLI